MHKQTSKNKTALDAVIKTSLAKSHARTQIIRDIYLAPEIKALNDDFLIKSDILERIRRALNIPYTHIHITGSSKTGYSYYKDRDFIPAESDLDIAIIDSPLFCLHQEAAVRKTNNYTNLTSFTIRRDIPDVPGTFRRNLSLGYIRPDLLPECPEKDAFLRVFENISNAYITRFKSVTGAIYLTEKLFEMKQEDLIQQYINKNP